MPPCSTTELPLEHPPTLTNRRGALAFAGGGTQVYPRTVKQSLTVELSGISG